MHALNSRLAVAALLLFSLTALAAPDAKRVVLPDTVTPQAYRIDFTPNVGALTFTGTAEIDVTVNRATSTIVLNSADIVIDSATVTGETGKPTIAYDEKVETATFTFGKPLAMGAHTLKLAYHGTIRTTASGLFALDYQGPKGKLRALFTQFENSDARRFVPCWDEPGIKTTFELAATLPADLMPLSNMPVAGSVKTSGGLQHVRFAKSPKMSTYLLFFGLGDFERVHRVVQGVDIGIVVKRGDTANAGYALDAASALLPYYNDYFGVPYPLPKLDLIGGPGSSQFFGAMENWGAIFYFEKLLLVDPRLTTKGTQQQVYLVIAHEMAHQWFGDLVTMAWWDDLWLNEGFASWMASKSTDHFHPEWAVWLKSMEEKNAVMQRDARDGTHPILQDIEDVFQAANAFDDITYYKGEAVIRSIESYIGEAQFRAGVRRYMREHQYGNTVTDDLWAAMAKESAAPVPQIAHDLTKQAGVPMVNLLSSSCSGGKTTLSLNQTHFAIDASSTSARVWHLPVKVATLGAAPTSVIVSGEQPTQVETAGCGAVILNAGQGGYLRSRYNHDALAALATHFAELTPDDQIGVLKDTASLANAGRQPMADYLELTKHFPATAHPVVVSALVGQFLGIDDLYRGLDSQAAYRAYARSVLKPVFARVGWDAQPGGSDNDIILRADLIEALAEFEDADALAWTRERFERYLANPKLFDANARSSLLHNVALHADQRLWDRLHNMAKSATSELERQDLYDLLGLAESDVLAKQALGLVFSDELASSPTTGPRIISAVSQRHPEMALDFSLANWDKVYQKLEVGSALQYLPALARNSTDLKSIDKLNAFANAKVPENARQDYVLAAARIRYQAKVRAERLPEVDRWLAAQAR